MTATVFHMWLRQKRPWERRHDDPLAGSERSENPTKKRLKRRFWGDEDDL